MTIEDDDNAFPMASDNSVISQTEDLLGSLSSYTHPQGDLCVFGLQPTIVEPTNMNNPTSGSIRTHTSLALHNPWYHTIGLYCGSCPRSDLGVLDLIWVFCRVAQNTVEGKRQLQGFDNLP